MITGATAPPTIVIISNEEASLVFVPASLNASENIVGNMMLSPRYRAKNAMRDKVPLHTTTINVATKVRMAQVSIPKPNAITRIGFSSTFSFVSASCALLGSGNCISPIQRPHYITSSYTYQFFEKSYSCIVFRVKDC